MYGTRGQDVASEGRGHLAVQHQAYLGSPFATLQHDSLLL